MQRVGWLEHGMSLNTTRVAYLSLHVAGWCWGWETTAPAERTARFIARPTARPARSASQPAPRSPLVPRHPSQAPARPRRPPPTAPRRLQPPSAPAPAPTSPRPTSPRPTSPHEPPRGHAGPSTNVVRGLDGLVYTPMDVLPHLHFVRMPPILSLRVIGRGLAGPGDLLSWSSKSLSAPCYKMRLQTVS